MNSWGWGLGQGRGKEGHGQYGGREVRESVGPLPRAAFGGRWEPQIRSGNGKAVIRSANTVLGSLSTEL